MTDSLQHHRDRLISIRKDHWRQYETSAEHEARAEAAETTAGWYFGLATVAQTEAYRATISGLAGFYSPRENRTREAAKLAWYASTAEARALFEITFNEVLRDGEVCESTSALWDALCAKTGAMEAA